MTTQELWRFENDEGYGPYNTGPETKGSLRDRLSEAHSPLRSDWHVIGHNCCHRWSLAGQLGVDMVHQSDTRTGCPSYADLLRWFGGWIDEIKEAGFQAVRYEYLEEHVIEVEEGLPQLVGIRPGAEGEGLEEFEPLKREVVEDATEV